MVIIGIPHAWDRSDNGFGSTPTTVPSCVSLTEISTRVAIVAGLALIALLIVVRRKPARNGGPSPRDHVEWGSSHESSNGDALVVGPLRKRALEIMGLGAIAIFGGIMVAIVVSLSIAWIVTNFLNRL
jgi:hypothetical protein